MCSSDANIDSSDGWYMLVDQQIENRTFVQAIDNQRLQRLAKCSSADVLGVRHSIVW